MKLKVGDKVRVMTGKDKGKEGKITYLTPTAGMYITENGKKVANDEEFGKQVMKELGMEKIEI